MDFGAAALGIPANRRSEWLVWLPVVAGLLVLYVPTYADLITTFWRYERGSHGPVILAISAWLLWRSRGVLIGPDAQPMTLAGWLLLAFGLICYVFGRSQDFFQFEAASQLPVLAGTVLALRGRNAIRRLWFPIMFLAFLVPVPGSLLDAVLLPMKQIVSVVAEEILYAFGYPIARTGVVLLIGPYQLLIADACSGLNSMVALTGIGLLFVYLTASADRRHTIALLLSILPIAFVANIVRVLSLLLVTYYLGDQAGRSVHNQAAYLEIIVAFVAFFAFDWLLRHTLLRRSPGMSEVPQPK